MHQTYMEADITLKDGCKGCRCFLGCRLVREWSSMLILNDHIIQNDTIATKSWMD